MRNIAIFASGSGSNAVKIIEHFQGSDTARVKLVLSNNPQAFALERARSAGVAALAFDREQFMAADPIVKILRDHSIDYVVLAGFLWLMPSGIVNKYRGRMINIHPALLPAHGGKGMYGDRVHRAVIEAGEKKSGITIHHVNELYDSGDIIAQYSTAVEPDDTPESLAAKIHALEHRYFPETIENEIKKL